MTMFEPLRLLIVNGNTSGVMTGALDQAAARLLPHWVQITVQGVAEGPAYIGDARTVVEAAAAISGHFASVIADGRPPWSAAVLACFGEPGLAAVRAICPFPVVGMAESGAHVAMQIGGDFAVVTPGEAWPRMLGDLYRSLGLGRRCLSIAAVPGRVRTLQEDPSLVEDVWLAVEKELARSPAPGAVVIGGAALVGVAERLQPRTGTPLVDSFSAAVGQALALAIARVPHRASAG